MGRLKQEFDRILQEAQRCLYCVDAPCIKGCPVSVDVPQFIRHLRYENIKSAKKVIKHANPLGGICGYLCPSEELCQGKCVMSRGDGAVKIRELQKYVCDNAAYKPSAVSPKGKKVAVIGAGPTGLGCAAALALKGYQVDVFEKSGSAGGIVTKEIPGYRIPGEIIDKDIAELMLENLTINYGREITGQDLSGWLDNSYDAVYVATGLAYDRPAGVRIESGEDKIFGCSEFLAQLKGGKINGVSGTVCVIGGGDSAIDAACSALKAGADRSILAYRRSRKEMPAGDEEFLAAAGRGIELMYLVSPVGVRGNDGALEVTFIRNRLYDVPGESRKGFGSLAGNEFTIKVEYLIFALGKKADTELLSQVAPGEADRRTLRIGDTKYFAGGDYVNGGRTIVEAVKDGRAAAESIDSFLK